MTIIEKLERTLALAKELKFTDQQVEELVSLVLGLPITRVTWQQSPQPIPWVLPNTTLGIGGVDTPPGSTIICTNGLTPYESFKGAVVAPTKYGTVAEFLAGECTNVDLPVHGLITQDVRLDG